MAKSFDRKKLVRVASKASNLLTFQQLFPLAVPIFYPAVTEFVCNQIAQNIVHVIHTVKLPFFAYCNPPLVFNHFYIQTHFIPLFLLSISNVTIRFPARREARQTPALQSNDFRIQMFPTFLNRKQANLKYFYI